MHGTELTMGGIAKKETLRNLYYDEGGIVKLSFPRQSQALRRETERDDKLSAKRGKGGSMWWISSMCSILKSPIKIQAQQGDAVKWKEELESKLMGTGRPGGV